MGFPRFTFKRSGADVSASAVFLERRVEPLADDALPAQEITFFEMVASVGWRIGDKRGGVLYVKNPRDGSLVRDDRNEPVVDSDIPGILEDFRRSSVGGFYPWARVDLPHIDDTWNNQVVSLRDLREDRREIIDPKRWCAKHRTVVEATCALEHFSLGDVVDVVSEARPPISKAKEYKYVEIAKIGHGEYDFVRQRGWELPSRARVPCTAGDILVASIWSSVGKWFLVEQGAENLLCTSGCTRLRLRQGHEDYLPDLVAGLSSETFRVQMRAMATGSDGLATIGAEDIRQIVLPRLTDPGFRDEMSEVADRLRSGRQRIERLVRQYTSGVEDWPHVHPRSEHWVLV